MRRTLLITVALAALTWAAVTATALAASSPTVSTGAATSRNDTYATLNGTVNPNGAATTYYFQWGTSTGYGATSSTRSAGSGKATVAVRVTASGLTPGTRYHYRLVATNSSGTSTGSDRTFTTTGNPPPDVVTGPATSLSSNSALVNGTINPRGEATTWTVQYGTTPAYGVETFPESLPAGNAPVNVSTTLRGLSSATIFHYRFVARHGSTTVSYGGDQQFMTYPVTRPVPTVRAHTTPQRRRNRPFAFTTTGSVSHPSWIPSNYACTGQVRIRWFRGGRAFKSTTVSLQPNCTYTIPTLFQRQWKRPLTGFVRFLGNGYLASAVARRQARVTLG